MTNFSESIYVIRKGDMLIRQGMMNINKLQELRLLDLIKLERRVL